MSKEQTLRHIYNIVFLSFYFMFLLIQSQKMSQ